MCRPLDNAIVRTDSRRVDSLAWHRTRAGLSNRQTVAGSTVEAAVSLEDVPAAIIPEERSMITHQALINQDKSGSGPEPTNIPRRALLGGAGALVALLASPARVMAKAPNDPFVLLLKGLYEPVVHGPNLGLSVVNLSDGSYSKTKIYPVSGVPGNPNPNKAVGDFYAQVSIFGDLCAYHLPGGSFAMRFIDSDFIF